MENLIQSVINWAEERNIIKGSSIEKETLKLMGTFGRLSDFINNKNICLHGIGDAVIQLMILCRMRDCFINESLDLTKKITDDRIVDPQISLIMVMKHMGELAEHLYHHRNIKPDMGYLLVYLTAFADGLGYSVKECTEMAFGLIKNEKFIIFNGDRLEESDREYENAVKLIASIRKSRTYHTSNN